MGLYLRKSVKVGPLRFNLSKSGIGVSGGVRGFRVGTGPRGNYVHMGRHGVYYRSTFSGGGSNARRAQSPTPVERPPEPPDGLQEIESGAVEAMTHSSSAQLLEEIRTKRRIIRLWPWALFSGLLALMLVGAALPAWANLLAFLLILAGTVWVARRDTLRKTVVLMYDFDEAGETAFEALHNGFDWLAKAHRTWHLEAEGATRDWKRNAGATALVRRRGISLGKADPPDIKTNIAVPVVPVGRQRLYLLPDRVLVVDGRGVGAVGYDELTLDVDCTRFIESESVPKDAEVVGTTWRYVNKKGGPDKRFKDNRQLPILKYAQLHFQSPTGLNEVIHTSNVEAAAQFAAGVAHAAGAVVAAKAGGEPQAESPGPRPIERRKTA